MADIPGDTGIGLDIRYLTSGTAGDVVGVYPSGLFAGSFALTNVGSVSIHSSNRIGVSGIVEVSSMPSVVVTATDLDIRNLTKTSDNVATSGTATVAGSVYATGSMVISSASLLGVSGLIFTGGDIVGSVNIATSLPSIGSFTSQSVTAPVDEFIQRLEYSGTTNVPIYIGLAAPGTAVGTAGWQLRELSYGTRFTKL